MLSDLVKKNRSYRRFHQEVPVSLETLRELVDLARLSPSGGNIQPLRYVLSVDPDKNATIFRHLGWAKYLADWHGPEDGERPSAYIVMLGDKSLLGTSGSDQGIAAQSIMLGATEKGLGGCIMASIARERLRATLSIPEEYEILLVLALGRPKETVVIEPLGPDGNIRYWRTADGVHHVPKRSLDDLILE